MSNFSILLVILSGSIVNSSDEFLTIWTPNVINSEQDYNIAILPSEIDKRTEISFQICNSYATIHLTGEKLHNIKFESSSQLTASKANQIHVTLHRNDTSHPVPRQMCMSQTLNDVKSVKKEFNTFIQTDKPTYLPGDDVKFRIIVVDNNVVPYHVKNIQVKFIDPKGRVIQEFNDLDGDSPGVYAGTFKLSANTALGVWKIKVVVDKQHHLTKEKKFGVTKFKIPSFTAHIDIDSVHLLTNSTAQFSIYALDKVGNFVRGNAQLSIKCTSTGQVVLTKSFTDITGIHLPKYKVHEELKANTTTKLDYEATLVFTEKQSGISANKTVKFTVHADDRPKIEANHPEKFMPGLPFYTKVFVYDWKDKLIQSTPERVKVALECTLQDGTTKTILIDGQIKRGVAVVNVVIPENAIKLTVKVKYWYVTYKKNITMDALTVGVNKMAVDYLPKLPNYGDTITVYVKANTEIDQLIATVNSRHGLIESYQIYCSFKIICKFNLSLRRGMMPEAKVSVYRIENVRRIDKGEVTIVSEEIGRNTLNIEMSNSAKSRSKIDIKFNTKPDSTVYMIGYDKRLTDIFQGNEILKDDVTRDLTDYDGTNRVTAFDMKPNNWHECTEQELQRLHKGRRLVIDHFDWAFPAVEFEDEIVCVDDEEPEELSKSEDSDPTELSDITEDFRHLWMFNSIEVTGYDDKLTRSFIVPDSINSWMISSFSINDKSGLAIGEPKELIVKNEFFIANIIPKRIRFEEICRVDVMVYNFIKSKEAVDVTVKVFPINNKTNFRFYESESTSMPSNKTTATKTIKVPYDNAQKVSFYIQSLAQRTSFAENLIIRFDAFTTDSNRVMWDKKLRKLLIEPVGAETVQVTSKNYKLGTKGEEIVDFIEEGVTSKDDYKRYRIEVAGNFLTDNVEDESSKDMFPLSSLDQQTYMLKEKVEKLQYYKLNDTNLTTSGISEIYQSILGQRAESWNFKNTSGYIAMFIDTIVFAMAIGALPKDTKTIEKEFDVLKASQIEDGSFGNFGNMLEVQGDTNSVKYFQTAFILIPFLKFRRFVTKNYDDVIEKGFKFMNGTRNLEWLDKEALSVAAYAYALNGDKNQTLEILNEVERNVEQIGSFQKCYKLSANHSSCSLRLTSYSTLAYLTINQTDNIHNCVKYLLLQHNLRSYHGTNLDQTISVEALSKFLTTNPVNNPTNLKVKFSSERGLEKILDITSSNKIIRHEFVFPDNTLHPKISITGTGFCSVRKIIESRITVEQQNSKFNVTATPLPVLVQNERIVRICATYQPQGNASNSQSLFSVIYDVEMPSGYIFDEIMNLSSIPEIKLTQPRLSRSQVQVYFNDFKEGTNYCIDMKAIKIYEVKNIQKASVKVFDNNDSENASILFYTFKSDDCKPSVEASNSTTEVNEENLKKKLINSTSFSNMNSRKLVGNITETPVITNY